MGIIHWFKNDLKKEERVLTRDLISMAIIDGEFKDEEVDEIERILKAEGISTKEMMDSLRGAQHRGSADVNILDGVLKRSPLSLNGLLERIEVHHHHVDGGDAVGFHLLDMLGVRAHGEESAVHFGVQGLHAPVHNLGKARHLADADGGNTRSLQRLARAACGYNLKS